MPFFYRFFITYETGLFFRVIPSIRRGCLTSGKVKLCCDLLQGFFGTKICLSRDYGRRMARFQARKNDSSPVTDDQVWF